VSEERSGHELPPAAEARMAEIRRSGTWGSALSADEFTAIRSVGFEAVGQVLGAAVYNVGYAGGYGCPGAWAGYGGYVAPYQSVTSVSSGGSVGSFGPMVQTLYQARHKAIERMSAECVELGGHGVVGVLLTIGAFPAGGLEFKAIGTAVRAPGAVPLKQPFTSDLSGQDFAKLIMAGWVPAGLAHQPDPVGERQLRGNRVHRPGEPVPARRAHPAGQGRGQDGRARRGGAEHGPADPRARVPDAGAPP